MEDTDHYRKLFQSVTISVVDDDRYTSCSFYNVKFANYEMGCGATFSSCYFEGCDFAPAAMRSVLSGENNSIVTIENGNVIHRSSTNPTGTISYPLANRDSQ